MTPRPVPGLVLLQVRSVPVYTDHHVTFLVAYSGICTGGTVIQQLFNSLVCCFVYIILVIINSSQG